MTKVKERDLKSALEFLYHHCALGLVPFNDTPSDWKKARKTITEEFNKSLKTAQNTELTRKQIKKIPIFDNGRRPEKYIKNPIIVAVIGKQKFILDGNHRAIVALESGVESLPALTLKLPQKMFSLLLEYESNYEPKTK